MSTTAEAAIAVIGVTGLAHLHAVDSVHAFVTAKTTGNAVSPPKGQATGAQFGKWIGGVVALSVVLLAGSESATWGPVFDTLGVLVAVTGLVLYYHDVFAMFGVGTS